MWGASAKGSICLAVSCPLCPSRPKTAGSSTHSLPALALPPVFLLAEYLGDGGDMAGGPAGCTKMQAIGSTPLSP